MYIFLLSNKSLYQKLIQFDLLIFSVLRDINEICNAILVKINQFK